MGRDEHNSGKGKKKHKLPQTPDQQKHPGRDIEFSEEMADHEDFEALERSREADQRVHNRNQDK
ncbi:YfhD family protein [Halobacillus shinanisalinarum]|uniref:YfhD family protein n=1 Tax=Halobacillus shinanisalinarum TaxID=2932258 RepID=A0ABY4H1H5_9BACI|nr:YfhD family protein [Halobacillus shinanisalinarum]UOQ94288.1 YfhD family protein [Halobacillus shinanisalinarum]